MNATRLKFLPVPASLAPHVQSFWVFEHRGQGRYSTLLHPDGGAGASIRCTDNTARIDTPRPSSMRYEVTNVVHEFGVRLRTGNVRLLGETAVCLEAAAHDANRQQNAVVAVERCGRIFDRLSEDLERVFSTAPTATAAAQMMVLLEADSAVATVKSVAARLGTTRRTLERSLARDAGLTAHELIAICRYARAIDLLKCEDLTLAQISHDAGYSDQAHMTRDFRRRSGLTPASLRRMKLASSARFDEEGAP